MALTWNDEISTEDKEADARRRAAAAKIQAANASGGFLGPLLGIGGGIAGAIVDGPQGAIQGYKLGSALGGFTDKIGQPASVAPEAAGAPTGANGLTAKEDSLAKMIAAFMKKKPLDWQGDAGVAGPAIDTGIAPGAMDVLSGSMVA